MLSSCKNLHRRVGVIQALQIALFSEAPRVGQFIRVLHVGVEFSVLPLFGQLDLDSSEECRGVPRRLPIEPKEGEALPGVHQEGHISHANAHTFGSVPTGRLKSSHWQATHLGPVFSFFKRGPPENRPSIPRPRGQGLRRCDGTPSERAGMFKIISDVD